MLFCHAGQPEGLKDDSKGTSNNSVKRHRPRNAAYSWNIHSHPITVTEPTGQVESGTV